jgi:hypothetical protein
MKSSGVMNHQKAEKFVINVRRIIKMNNHLIDCNAEYKRLRQLQYNCEWEDKYEDAKRYQLKALYYKDLLDKGIFHEPRF